MTSSNDSPVPPSALGPIMVVEVGPDGSGTAPRPMTQKEYRIIAEQLVLGLLDAGIDVSEWKTGAGT